MNGCFNYTIVRQNQWVRPRQWGEGANVDNMAEKPQWLMGEKKNPRLNKCEIPRSLQLSKVSNEIFSTFLASKRQ